MRKSPSYWKDRFEQLEKAAHSYSVTAYRDIDPAFEQAQREIQKEIEAWYGRLAKNNNVSIQDARRLLSASELKEFKWDVNEYIKYGRENTINQQWMKELENASARFHISRLEALKIRTQQAAEVAFGNELDVVDKMARKVYTESYYHSIFEAQKGFNIGWEIGQIDERKLNKILTKPWAADGKNFSERIWQSKTQLINELHNELTRTCILGSAPDRAIKNIAKKFDVTKHQAGRLVMTEQTFIHSVAQKEAFAELDVERYEIVATLDSRTSEICRTMDGKVFPLSEYAPGSTAPPFHPYCRSVTVPFFEDNYGGMRAARDENGNTYYVPDNMTYREWEKKYVVDSISNADKAMYERYKSVLQELSPKSLEDFVDIKYNKSTEWERLKHQYRTLNQYKIDSGALSAQEILDLDTKIISEKRNNFSSKFRTSGNIAGAYIDGDINKLYIAHSRISSSEDIIRAKYSGNSIIAKLQEHRQFEYIDVLGSNGVKRTDTYEDTEAKLFEYLAVEYDKKPYESLTMLSERGMCDSCLGVMAQFKKKYNVTINAISNKKVNGNVWKHRMRKKK